jgi:hypothetical protein
MIETRLQMELAEARAEIQSLRERTSMSLGKPTVHKDMSQISLVQKWSGSESAVPLEEFFSAIEGSARIEKW